MSNEGKVSYNEGSSLLFVPKSELSVSSVKGKIFELLNMVQDKQIHGITPCALSLNSFTINTIAFYVNEVMTPSAKPRFFIFIYILLTYSTCRACFFCIW